MISIFYFIDPAFFSTTDIRSYLESNTFNSFVEFYNRIVKIEDSLLPEGSKNTIFNFPLKDQIIHDCLIHPPSCDPGLTKKFYRIFNIFSSRYIFNCNIESSIDNSNVIYENNLAPIIIQEGFNEFLNNCITNRNLECLCNEHIPPTPIYITNETEIKPQGFFEPFTNPDSLFDIFPYVVFFPHEIETLNEKLRKFDFMLNCNYFNRQRKFPEQQYRILDEFWDSELLYNCDLNMQNQIISIMTDLIESPNSLRNERKKLKHEIFRLDDTKKNLEQCYIFQTYILNGIKITPRLRFFFHENEIFFVDIIDRH